MIAFAPGALEQLGTKTPHPEWKRVVAMNDSTGG